MCGAVVVMVMVWYGEVAVLGCLYRAVWCDVVVVVMMVTVYVIWCGDSAIVRCGAVECGWMSCHMV